MRYRDHLDEGRLRAVMHVFKRLCRSALVLLPLFLLAILLAPPVPAQQASFAGTVLNEAGEKPVANVEIMLDGKNLSVRSDSAGNFVITGLAAGRYTVLVRHVGFEPLRTDIVLGATQKMEVDLLIKPTVTKLGNVDVNATATKGPWAIRLVEFDERRTTGIGRFLTADYFESKDGRPASSFLLEKIPGLRFVQTGGRNFMASTRGANVSLRPQDIKRDPKRPSCLDPQITGSLECTPVGQCYMQVVVNGITRYDGSGQMFDIDQLNSKDIIGFEFFTVAAAPLQYRGSTEAAKCGTVIIWTKGG